MVSVSDSKQMTNIVTEQKNYSNEKTNEATKCLFITNVGNVNIATNGNGFGRKCLL